MPISINETPSAEVVRELFEYKPLEGELVWKKSPTQRIPAGTIAGHITKYGYRRIMVQGALYFAHRLIWKFFYGTDPKGQVDHKGQEGVIPKRNHIHGLQDLTSREHTTLTRKANRVASLPTGVTVVRKGRYQARIEQDRKLIYLGSYDTPGEASKAYLKALKTIKEGGLVVSAAKPTSSQFKGVSWHKKNQKWMAYHRVNGKRKHLGLFLTEEQAHQAYLEAIS